MYWLDNVVNKLIQDHPDGEILVSSGVSPSGTYHLGTLREVLTAEVILRELKNRGRKARHVHVVDDLDVFRKVPVDVPNEFDQYLGRPLCDVPAPDGSDMSYADYFLKDLLEAAKNLHLEMEVVRAHQKYREGYFVSAIEKSLDNNEVIRKILEDVSGRKLDESWSPIQIIEDGYLKNRQFVSIDKDDHLVKYLDKDNKEQTVSYEKGEVKLSWRIDWPARWWLLGVDVEPFGKDHATKGGSYDTGKRIVEEVFDTLAPLPVPYNFINRTGDTKKMSKSAGDTVTASQLLTILPAEVVWYFVIRYSPDKLLFFDQGETLAKIIDEFAALLAKPDKTEDEEHLIQLCLIGVDKPTITNIPFSHLIASYQASLRESEKTIEVIERTEHKQTAKSDREVIIEELRFIDTWLDEWAPVEMKFSLLESFDSSTLTETQKRYLQGLADKIEKAPEDADGEWFHLAIYGFKEELGMHPKELFSTLYQAVIGKDYGPRAGWFLSILPREWLVERLSLK